MALTYAVLGSGAMGLRFGLLLKEHLGAQVDFIDTWEEQIDTFLSFLINKCICHSCSNEVSISSTKINMFSQE